MNVLVAFEYTGVLTVELIAFCTSHALLWIKISWTWCFWKLKNDVFKFLRDRCCCTWWGSSAWAQERPFQHWREYIGFWFTIRLVNSINILSVKKIQSKIKGKPHASSLKSVSYPVVLYKLYYNITYIYPMVPSSSLFKKSWLQSFLFHARKPVYSSSFGIWGIRAFRTCNGFWVSLNGTCTRTFTCNFGRKNTCRSKTILWGCSKVSQFCSRFSNIHVTFFLNFSISSRFQTRQGLAYQKY